MSHSDRQRMMDLVADYFVRELTPQELEQMQQFLENDAEARQMFADAGRDEWLLHHVHHMETGKIVYLNTYKDRFRGIRAIAAAVAIITTLGAVFYAQKATISEMIASKNAAPVVAEVTECFAPDGAAISVVNDGDVRKLHSAASIRVGDRLVIPPGGQLSFQYLEEETEIRLEGGSRAHVSERNGAKQIRLKAGRLYAEVAKQPSGSPMRVSTHDAEVVVLGTSFEVFAGEITRLSVISGKVRFNSLKSDESVVVSTGSLAETGRKLAPRAYTLYRCKPQMEVSLNQHGDNRLIAVDPVRNYEGLLTFDLSEVQGRILEAQLQMRVMKKLSDNGGEGDLRLFSVDPGLNGKGDRIQVGHFSGGAGKDKDLILDMDAGQIKQGLNTFLITLDPGGNDFWFSSSRGPVAPILELTVVED